MWYRKCPKKLKKRANLVKFALEEIKFPEISQILVKKQQTF
jgi:hypothetical protein